ncbi:unnamed protein product, partial [Protopolystoma xenopodis]
MEIDVIDVNIQQEEKMQLKTFIKHFLSEKRERLLNVLSLEFSKSKLSEIVSPPHVVREISLVDNFWPQTIVDDECEEDLQKEEASFFSRPSVQKYCLMSMSGSYTDFHIDFSGSVYQMERKSGTEDKFLFPYFEKLHWFVASGLLGKLRHCFDNGEPALIHEIAAARQLPKCLLSWLEARRKV